MNVKSEKVEKNVVQLEIEVGADRFEQAVQAAYRKNAKKFSIPGFRRGKAPRKLIERVYGEGVFYEDAVDDIIAATYPEAAKDLSPVDSPELNIKQIGYGKDFIYTAKVTVKPEVEMGDYKALEVKRIEHRVTDEDVDREIKNMLERAARLVDADDKPVESGSIVSIDFEGFIDGKPFEGGKAEGYSLTIGSGQFIPGFEEQIIGRHVGEEFDVSVTFPSDYHQESLASKDAVFKVKINSIKIKEYPELDDEFAKDISEFDTLEALKNAIREKLEENARERARREQRDAVVQAVAEKAKVDIPQVMVEKQIDEYVRDAQYRLSMQGVNFEKYLEYTGGTMEQFRDSMKERALNEVKARLVIEKVAQLENVEITDEDIENELKKLSEQYKMEVERVKELLGESGLETLKRDALMVKTVDLLCNMVKYV